MAKRYEIRDWAGNLMFKGKTFKTFEDGWDHIYTHVTDDSDYQELFVEEIS